jgi:hypothetical protein
MKISNFVLILFAVCLLSLVLSGSAYAKPPKGFHEGPYVLFGGGLLNFAIDDNVRTNTKVGRDYEPAASFAFGWNVTDWIAPELQVRYATNKAGGEREHIADINLNAVASLIVSALADAKHVQFIPFVQAGPLVQAAIIPKDPGTTDASMRIWSPGFGFGGGMKFIFLRYTYVSLVAQCDIVSVDSQYQEIGGVRTRVLQGGLDTQPGFNGMIGFHF